MKENKFMVGEEEESTNGNAKVSNGTTATTNKKQPVRHHVKRRSSGRVHVAKLAPMARANAAYTDSEADFVDDTDNNTNNRPVMRRSQSQRSLNRLSLDRKGFTALTKRKSTHTEKAIETTQTKDEEEEEEKPEDVAAAVVVESTEKKTSTSTHSTINPASLTSRVVAAPVEQTLNAVANTLVIPKTKIIPTNISLSPMRPTTANTTTTKAKKQPLRSQFLASSYEEPSYITNRPDFHMTSANGRTPKPSSRSTSNNMSRTQQKLMLQKQQSQVDDETSPIHPRNMQKINKELEILSKETRCIKRYVDPMRASLIRCSEKNTQKPHPAINRLQLGASKQFSSTSTLPTMNGLEQQQLLNTLNSKRPIPHLEQRQIAHRHHHLKSIALSRSASDTDSSTTPTVTANTVNPLWNLLDRMFSA